MLRMLTAVRVTGHMVIVVMLLGLSASASTADPRAALSGKSGWDALAVGHPGDAARAFRDALARDPQNPRLHLGAGAAAYAEGRDADARTELERALQLAPGMLEARALVGAVQYRAGDLPAAIATFESIVSDAPSIIEARATLERWRREADLTARMQKVTAAGFTVSFEGPAEEALAQRVLASLDRAYWRVGALLGAFPLQTIPVVVYTTRDFADITQMPEWAAGAYDGTIRVPMRDTLTNPAELDRVIAHEFTHALVRSLARRGVPGWLDEGLATALEADDLSWAEHYVRDAQAPASLGTLVSGFAQLDPDQARLAYATSALAVRHLLDDAGGSAVANLLRDLGDGIDFDVAFRHRINRSPREFASGYTF